VDVLHLARDLERRLGDARDPAQLFSFAQRVTEDEAQQYPADAMAVLTGLGLQRHYVPQALGGALQRFDQLGALVRVVARRDLSVAISHAVSFLGSMGVWLSGDERQQQALADAVLGGERVSLALTEEGSGSDLLQMQTRADATGGGYRLQGDKWLVNGLGRNRFALVYARTAESPGPRSYGLFLVDKHHAAGCEALPKIATLGVRGADISGMRFDALLPADARIGAEGSGFETVLKGLQLSRSLCGALSLGALDTALETALRFTLHRPIYGKTVSALPQSQKLIAESWAELLIADSLAGLALRGLQAVPGQASVHSAVLKYLVPTLAEQAITRLAVVHGARYYLRDQFEAGIFQKMLRDNLLIGLFDGSTQVNLFSLSQQLRGLATRIEPAGVPAWARRDAPLPAFDWHALALSSGGRDDVFAGFSSALQALRDALRDDATAARWIEGPLRRLASAHAALLVDARELTPEMQVRGHPQIFELSRRYAVLSAAAALLAERQLNREALAGSLARPAVLAVALQRLAAALGDATLLPAECYAGAFETLLTRRERHGHCGLYALPD
jgi:alkylation response protein AidB-like acyl-CoA dehydrogenase